MKTVTLQIGNTDNKLSQTLWSNFCKRVHNELIREYISIHFYGVSHFDAPWQNACFVFIITDNKYEDLKKKISDIGKEHNQDSVAWTEGETQFI